MQEPKDLPVSEMAENLVGSEIIKLAGEIKKKIANGASIHNFTIGDFNPAIFPIPAALKEGIIHQYQSNQTNYPAANGMPELRTSVSKYIEKRQGLSYHPDEVLISGGARPLIYAAYQAVVDPTDKIVFPVPSWNNNHYTHLSRGNSIMVETSPESNFMPTAQQLEDKMKDARLLALCSPLNPTGTCFTEEQLLGILELVRDINQNRDSKQEKPLYLIYDQIYWQLTLGSTKHVDPVSLMPELRPYTIYIDGLSKAFAATGVRVGWAMGPAKIIGKMRAILGHVGAWSPKAEQLATANFLQQDEEVDSYLKDIKSKIDERLTGFFNGIQSLKEKGMPVNAIDPQGAMYLTVQFNLIGAKTSEGNTLEKVEDVTSYLLNEAGLAIVPFYAFGADRSSTWYRLSVGTAQQNHPSEVTHNLEKAISKLQWS
ncbi:MAG: aminotransferase class I/II-fold pyridoxal phosphate-dependent enzyme [Bacteroidota bacterium]